jgi:hypothetical protein
MGELITALQFARIVRDLSSAAHRAGLRSPGFRMTGQAISPLTVRWDGTGDAVVELAKGLTVEQTQELAIEGILRANNLTDADQAWGPMWVTLAGGLT